MSQNIRLNGYGNDSITVPMVGETQVNNKTYVIVDLGTGVHHRGIHLRYVLVSTDQIASEHKNIQDVRVYNNDEA